MKRIPRLVARLTLALSIAPLAQAEEAASPAPPRATIVLVGAASVGVKEVVTELLSRDGMDATWSTQESFQPRTIFDRRTPSGVAAWIDLSSPGEARLYFCETDTDRFFLRSLPLPNGIDEIAKEEIAHIVSNATVALHQGRGATLTRSEARQALRLPAPTEEVPAAAPLPTPLRLSLSALAGAQLFATDLPVVAKGTLSFALTRGPRWNRTAGSFGAWMDLGYQLPGRYRGDAVGADVKATSVRAGLLWEREHLVLLRIGLGAGADRVAYQPKGDNGHVTLSESSSFTVPVLSLWVGMDLCLLDWLALTSRISVDATLAKVHFDLHDSNGATTRVLVPYPVLPAAALGLAIVF